MKIEYPILAILGIISFLTIFYLKPKEKKKDTITKIRDFGGYFIIGLGVYGLVMTIISLF